MNYFISVTPLDYTHIFDVADDRCEADVENAEAGLKAEERRESA